MTCHIVPEQLLTPIGQPSWPYFHDSPTPWHLLLSPLWSSSDPQAWEPKLRLSLICSAVGCRHLESTNSFKLRSVGPSHHLVYVRIPSSPGTNQGQYLVLQYTAAEQTSTLAFLVVSARSLFLLVMDQLTISLSLPS